MVTTMEQKKSLIFDIEKLSQNGHAGIPSWFHEVRQKGLNRFKEIGVPTTRDEEWKYTNLSVVAGRQYRLAPSVSFSRPEALRDLCTQDDFNVVVINGRLSPEFLSFENLPRGVAILSLREALKSHGEEIRDLLQRYPQDQESAFVALNHAVAADGIFVRIADETVIEKTIHIIHVTDADGEVITVPRSVVISGRSSEATVLESHLAFDDGKTYLAVALTDILLHDNAILHYCKAQSESRSSYHVGATRVWQERNSSLDGFSLATGGLITRNDLDVSVNGEGSSSILDGFYAVDKKQLVDNHTSVDHRVPNCTSNQLYKGILNGESHAVFNGKIFVRSIAQQTNSYQLNKNLILGTNCQVDTKPQLEIFANDVKCTHGATIGQLNEDEVFYLRSRCISKKGAIKLLAHGFVDDILSRIKSPSIYRKLHILLEPALATLE